MKEITVAKPKHTVARGFGIAALASASAAIIIAITAIVFGAIALGTKRLK